MGKDVKVYDAVFNTLEIYAECESIRCENHGRIRHNIERLKGLEQQHCKNDPTHYDYTKVLEGLLEKENAVIDKTERLIAVSVLRKGLEKCD